MRYDLDGKLEKTPIGGETEEPPQPKQGRQSRRSEAWNGWQKEVEDLVAQMHEALNPYEVQSLERLRTTKP